MSKIGVATQRTLVVSRKPSDDDNSCESPEDLLTRHSQEHEIPHDVSVQEFYQIRVVFYIFPRVLSYLDRVGNFPCCELIWQSRALEHGSKIVMQTLSLCHVMMSLFYLCLTADS